MQIHLSPRNLRLTAAIHQHAASKIEHLEDIADDIIAAHVVLVDDASVNPKKQFTVKAHLALPGPDVHAEHCGDDLYVVMDEVADRLARQLRKRRTAFVDKRREKSRRAKQQGKRPGA
jgi:putative sigma-54 modulation protein